MQEKHKIPISKGEFDLIDNVLRWYLDFYEDEDNHCKVSYLTVNKVADRIDKDIGTEYTLLTHSELYYLISACEYAKIEVNYNGLDDLLEKLKVYLDL